MPIPTFQADYGGERESAGQKRELSGAAVDGGGEERGYFEKTGAERAVEAVVDCLHLDGSSQFCEASLRRIRWTALSTDLRGRFISMAISV